MQRLATNLALAQLKRANILTTLTRLPVTDLIRCLAVIMHRNPTPLLFTSPSMLTVMTVPRVIKQTNQTLCTRQLPSLLSNDTIRRWTRLDLQLPTVSHSLHLSQNLVSKVKASSVKEIQVAIAQLRTRPLGLTSDKSITTMLIVRAQFESVVPLRHILDSKVPKTQRLILIRSPVFTQMKYFANPDKFKYRNVHNRR